MQTTIEETPVIQKAKELCQTILDQPNMQSIRQRIDSFMANDAAKAQYDAVMTRGQALQQKQESSIPLASEEIDAFEKQRDALMNNPVARGFFDAQEELHEVQESVTKLVNKTLELGRMPTEDDLGGGCGHGCGCHH
jgi:cell fate (sporulation/competence/biofilm development) regulator YlbF (YheA/YmcA/DUF963 family)